MQNDNTLGAPTEGLGQQVTFQIGDSGGVSQLQPRRTASLRAGQQGGGQARITSSPVRIQDTSSASASIELLGRLGGAILQPKIEAAKKEAFLDGVRQVATGTAVKEIVDEQPWYSTLFGDTPVVEGARSYAAFSKVQEEALAIEQNMPTLRQQSPKEFQKYLSTRMSELTTGDQGTDALVTQSLIKELPSLMKTQAKEHLAWQQQQFAEKTRNAQITAASRFTAQASRYNSAAQAEDLLVNDSPSAFNDENDVLEAEIKFVSAFAPVPGVPAETHAKLTTQVVSDLLSQRNLRAYYTLERSGAISETVIGPDNAKKLREQADRSEARARAEMPQPIVDMLTAIKAMPELYDEKGINDRLKRAISQLNAAHMQYTGGREPLIQGETASELRSSLLRNQIRDERRVIEADARAKDKLLDAATKKAEHQSAVNGAVGVLSNGAPTSRLPKAVVRDAWDTLRANPEKLHAARAATFHLGDVDEDGQGAVRSAAQAALTANDPAQFDTLYRREYLPMVVAAGGSEHVAKAYFGQRDSEFADTFSKYHNLVKYTKDSNQLVAAYTIARTQGPKMNLTKDSTDTRAIAALSDELDGFLGFGKDLDPRFATSLWGDIRPLVEGKPGNLPDNIRAAVATKRQRGLEFTGRYYWQGDEPNAFQRAVELAGNANPETAVRHDRFGKLFNATVDTLVSAQGLSPDTVRMFFQRGRDQQPRIEVLGFNRANEAVMFTIRPQDVDALDKEQRNRNAVQGIIPEGLTGPQYFAP